MKLISFLTKKRTLLVPEAKGFNILTACYINGEFKLISEYDVSNQLFEKLKNI